MNNSNPDRPKGKLYGLGSDDPPRRSIAAGETRFWDDEWETCMYREDHTGADLEVFIKFYGKEEHVIPFSHELYVEGVFRGRATEIDEAAYLAGRDRPADL